MPDRSQHKDSVRKRVVVVTGSGRGIGRAVAMEFAKSGYYTMINDLEQQAEVVGSAVVVVRAVVRSCWAVVRVGVGEERSTFTSVNDVCVGLRTT